MQIIIVDNDYDVRFYAEKMTKEKKELFKQMGAVYKVNNLKLLLDALMEINTPGKPFLPTAGVINNKAGLRIQNHIGSLERLNPNEALAQIITVFLREPNPHHLADNKQALTELWLTRRVLQLKSLHRDKEGNVYVVKPEKIGLERIWT